MLPECRDDFIDESNAVRLIYAFVDALDLAGLGFDGAEPAATGRPSYHPSLLPKLCIYGYLNRVQSSRRLETLWLSMMAAEGSALRCIFCRTIFRSAA